MAGRLIDRVFPFRGLPAPVYVLFFARIINRMGDFVRYFLTLYLTRILGLPPAQAGLVVTAAAFSSMAGALLSGRVSDSLGKKTVMLTSQSLSAALLIVCGFSPEGRWLPYVLIASQFFFGAIRPASQALVTDIAPVEMRQKAFGLLYFGINVGVALGPIIAGFLFESHRRWIFWGDAATTLIGVMLVAVFVREPASHEVQRGDEREDSDDAGSLRALIARPILMGFMGIMVLTNFVYAQTHFALPLLMDHFFDASGARNLGFLMSVNAVTVLVATPAVLGLLNKRRPALNMALGGFCYALGFGCLAVIPGTMGWILGSTVIWTLGEVLFATNSGVFTAAYTPLNHRSRFASIEQLTWGLGAVLSPAMAGALTEALGSRGVWFPIFGLSLAVVLGMIALDVRDKRQGIPE